MVTGCRGDTRALRRISRTFPAQVGARCLQGCGCIMLRPKAWVHQPTLWCLGWRFVAPVGGLVCPPTLGGLYRHCGASIIMLLLPARCESSDLTVLSPALFCSQQGHPGDMGLPTALRSLQWEYRAYASAMMLPAILWCLRRHHGASSETTMLPPELWCFRHRHTAPAGAMLIIRCYGAASGNMVLLVAIWCS